MMAAILFGSISTLADTSEIQRRAFNEAFEAHGLDWKWGRDDYIAMLGSNGGAQRIADYAKSRNETVDAAAVHATKSSIFQELISMLGIEPRAGVLDAVAAAKAHNVKLGLVTTTSPENVTALLAGLPEVSRETFDVVVDSTNVDTGKPDPASYRYALDQLGEDADSCVAIEDNVGGVHAAKAASVICVAFPNQNTVSGDFSEAVEVVGQLDADRLRALTENDH
ncbi:HAD superfamily hydrolase (TIGR01509 family)/HAD superfamily hydrolase (TIGR01549 family) [Williamsia limnetica]|jgi:HAD superfamily hydrolase (TIGR01509 family)|uniref:HAD superfamily hydrolase (TIGR01509 family)/HAD superfamily hydrolase (TIGR01549 family) n=2 Tax=Williamsia limnetica TaxID=882452 RepID=A0A318RQD7_WILLI|nr:HAD superfamily hydrolase (TIGR01509 family)/HAD superfamily hydrolase (TIGR01549 family) [Williamsia limnetica]